MKMKRIISVVLGVLILCSMAIPTFADTRAIDTSDKNISLRISANTCYVVLHIKSLNSSVIEGKVTLTGPQSFPPWTVKGTGEVETNYTKTVTKSGTYKVTFEGHCGTEQILISDTFTKP